MSEKSRREVILKMRERSAGRGRKGRGRLLDELCELCGDDRKHAIKLLRGKVPVAGGKERRGGPRPRYGEEERVVVKEIWLSAGQLRERVLSLSAATLDRLLAPCRVAQGRRGRCGTRPGTLLRKQISVRTEHWDVDGPGWIEADTVAHCGEFLNALYAREWSAFRNFFCPAMKHLRTEVEGSRRKRLYDQPLTPFERLKACGRVDAKKIAELEEIKAALNPFALKRSVEKKLRQVLRVPQGRTMKAAA